MKLKFETFRFKLNRKQEILDRQFLYISEEDRRIWIRAALRAQVLNAREEEEKKIGFIQRRKK